MPTSSLLTSIRFLISLVVVLMPVGAVELVAPVASVAPAHLVLAVDGSDLPHGLLHVHQELVGSGGDLVLVFPKWIPGAHAPAGRITNLVNLHFHADAQPVRWDRDDGDPYRFIVHAPPGATRIAADFTYVANKVDTNSAGVDVESSLHLAVINWNCCVLYPEGAVVAELPVDAALTLPAGWNLASALGVAEHQDAHWRFMPTNLRDLVDQPLIGGNLIEEIPLAATGTPPLALSLGSADGEEVALDPAWKKRLGASALQAQRLFGHAHFASYRWLFVVGESFDDLGLEHATSSLNGFQVEALEEFSSSSYAERNLPVHEFVHSWCGKYVRPAAMMNADFQAAQHTSLLWVYEGLTQYLGEVLGVRAGMAGDDEFRAQLAANFHDLAHQRGRAWRSLEDTARSGYLMRDPGSHYPDLHRDEEYYLEGMLFWFEADLIIRSESQGQRSLDDFCQSFLGAPIAAGAIRTYGLDDLVTALTAVQPYDWRTLIRTRVSEVRPRLEASDYERSGWRLDYAPAVAGSSEAEDEDTLLDARQGLGCEFRDGLITSIQAGSPAEQAGLRESDHVLAINGEPFAGPQLEAALNTARTSGSGKLVFQIEHGDEPHEVVVTCVSGALHPHLVRIATVPDLLERILTPR